MKNIYALTLFMLLFSFSSAINAQELDFYNTQWLSDGANGSNTSLSVDEGTTITVYSKAYEAGVTDAAGQGAGIECWIGFNSADTDPASWDESAWQVANFGQDNGNDDEYNYSTSSTAVGTHYIATRWRLDSGPYTYGGASATNGGAWDGVNNNNIGLTVNAVAQPLLITTSTCASATEVRLTGPWWGWNPAGGPIAADNGDGTWTFTFDPAPTDNMEYLLVVDGVQENLISIMANGGDCAPVTDYANYANRRWDVGSGNVTNTYGQCGSTCVAPVITLTGSDVTLNVGDTYTDDGATASDDEEGDISANIVVGGDTVDTATAGTYTITYDVSDGAGNAATTVSRVVTVEMPPCGNAIALTPGTQQCGDTSTFGDTIDDSSCLGSYDGGDDALYVYTATEDGETLDLTLSGQASWSGFAMSKGCPTGGAEVCVGSQTSSGSSALSFISDPLEAGEVYYIHISTYPSPQTTAFCLDATVIAAPSCLEPTSFATNDVASGSATLAWTAGATETTWNIEYGADGFTQGSGTTVAVSTNPYTISGLTPSTSYDVYIQADCGAGDTSEWVGPLSFTTPCETITPNYTEGFDPYLNECWSEATGPIEGPTAGTTTSGWVQDDFGNNTANGKSARFNIYATGGDEWLISPTFDLSSGGYEINLDVALTLYASTSSGTIGSDDAVYIMQSVDNGTTWTIIYTWDASNSPSNTGDNVTIDIASVTSATTKFAVFALEGTTSGGDFDFFVDNFAVRTPPSCLAPSSNSLSAANITTSAADVSWTAGDSETAWNIEYGPEGFTQGTGTTVAVTTNPYTITGLSSNTSYDVYVQADCGTSTSDWVGPYTFNTACDAYSTFPFTETFNSDSSSASCWTVDNANGDMDSWTTSYGSNTNEGDGVAAMYTDYNSGANDDWLISPGFQLTGNERLKFQQRVQSSGEPNDFEVLLSSTTAETASFTTVLLANAEYSNTAYQEIIIDLSSYTGVNYIAFHVANGGLDGWRLYIDDVVVEEIPSTPPGCAANFSNTLDASCGNFDFDISWDATDGADGYYITVGTTSGGSDIEASTDLGSATSYSFTNVQVATTYYYTVVPYNANGSATGCLEKSITTATTGCYCDSVPTSNDGSGISSVAFNGTDFTSGGDITYEDFTATAVEAGQSTTASLNITFATGYTYDTHVWVDLNDDYNFDSSELLFTGESLASDPTTLDASFLVPSDAPLGDHRVRIGTADSGQSTPNPCYSGTYGVTIDMTITVVAPPSCIGPSALTVSNLSDSSADISWTAGGTETDYEYVVQAAGTGEPTAAGTAVIGATSVSLTSLADNTDYEVYVRSACAGGEFSSWTGPLSFTTEPAPIVPAYTNDFSTYPGEFWTEGTGALADGPSGTTSAWSEDGFGNNGTTGAAKVNVYYSSFGGGNDDWLISPMFDLSGGTYYLNLNAALTVWNSTSSTTFGAGDFVALMVTEDDGSTWSELYRWDANNTPSATGDAMPEIDLSSYTSMTKFALYAESATGNVDNDFFIDDFQITTTSLGLDDNSISSFNYFPNPVNDVLTIKAQNNVEDVKVFNMLGQMVLRQNPNTRDCTVDLSAMQSGAYFVQVSIGNTVETVRVLKK